MIALDILRDEREHLRFELRELKNCQVRYFSLTVSGTAAFFGLASLSKIQNILPLMLLAPLIIILPCWWIFFDKATTITRMVGYYRILEEMIRQYPNFPYPYLGFENAIDYYRHKDNDETWKDFKKDRQSLPNKSKEKTKYTRHQYWNINFYTFAALGFLCIVLSSVSCVGKSYLWFLLPLLGFILYGIILTNAYRLLISLKTGDFSYSVITDFWRYILNILKEKERQGNNNAKGKIRGSDH